MASRLSPSLPIPNSLLQAHSTRVYVYGTSIPASSSSVWKDLMATRIASTRLPSRPVVRTLFPAVSIGLSRCGSSAPLVKETSLVLRVASVSKPSRATAILFYQLLSPPRLTGYCLVPRTGACSSGTLERVRRNLCCRDIRTPLSVLHLAHKEDTLPLALAT